MPDRDVLRDQPERLPEGMSVIHWAARQGRGDVIRSLPAADAARVNEWDLQGNTALHHAAAFGHLDAIRALIDIDAKVYAYNSRSGMTPLHLAAMAGRAEAILILAEAGADVNVRAGNRSTPLSLAVEGNRRDAVAALASVGANLLKTVYGETPRELAQRLRYGDLAQSLPERKSFWRDAAEFLLGRRLSGHANPQPSVPVGHRPAGGNISSNVQNSPPALPQAQNRSGARAKPLSGDERVDGRAR